MTTKDFLERYGVTLVIIGVFALVLAVLPGNKPASETSEAIADTTQTAAVDGSEIESGSLDVGSVGGTDAAGTSTRPAAAVAADAKQVAKKVTETVTAVADAVDKTLCRSDGRMKGISHYMPPCAGLRTGYAGKNGGATARGVTGKTIKLVFFRSQSDPATDAILTGARLADPPETVERVYRALVRYSNLHYQTYGREVVAEFYDASGPDSNDEAMKADAVKIAQTIKPFGVIGGPKTLGVELVQRGVICICTVSLTSQFYRSNPPYFFGSLPTFTEYSTHLAEYIGKRVAGRNAKWAGDEFNPTQRFRSKPRKFGLVYIEGSNGQVDPEGKRFRDLFVRDLAKYNVKLAAESSYIYDPGRNQQDITNMVASMRSKGVTTLIGVMDPLSPIFFTQEATRQAYYPEWIQTGTGLSDTTTAGRLYDQQQWKHSFGISPLWVTWTEKRMGPGYREYFHARPGDEPGDEGNLIEVYRAPVQTFFRGIQMAGPNLTADTFSQGQFRYPKTGGNPTTPLVYLTRQYPTEIKDFVEVFYDSDRRGKDERGADGIGLVMKVAGGKRYEPGEWPKTEPNVFKDAGALGVTGDPKLQDPRHEQDGHTHSASQKCLSCG